MPHNSAGRQRSFHHNDRCSPETIWHHRGTCTTAPAQDTPSREGHSDLQEPFYQWTMYYRPRLSTRRPRLVAPTRANHHESDARQCNQSFHTSMGRHPWPLRLESVRTCSTRHGGTHIRGTQDTESIMGTTWRTRILSRSSSRSLPLPSSVGHADCCHENHRHRRLAPAGVPSPRIGPGGHPHSGGGPPKHSNTDVW
jgi:hypothetical protein